MAPWFELHFPEQGSFSNQYMNGGGPYRLDRVRTILGEGTANFPRFAIALLGNLPRRYGTSRAPKYPRSGNAVRNSSRLSDSDGCLGSPRAFSACSATLWLSQISNGARTRSVRIRNAFADSDRNKACSATPAAQSISPLVLAGLSLQELSRTSSAVSEVPCQSIQDGWFHRRSSYFEIQCRMTIPDLS